MSKHNVNRYKVNLSFSSNCYWWQSAKIKVRGAKNTKASFTIKSPLITLVIILTVHNKQICRDELKYVVNMYHENGLCGFATDVFFCFCCKFKTEANSINYKK